MRRLRLPFAVLLAVGIIVGIAPVKATRDAAGAVAALPVHSSPRWLPQLFETPASSVASPVRASAPRQPTTAIPLVAGRPLSVRVDGSTLVTADGTPLQLRGVNVSGTEFACDQGQDPSSRGWAINADLPLDKPASFAAMQQWHIHVVRVPLNEDCWLGINGVNPQYGGSRYIAAIQHEVGLINALGMVAILDLHWSAPGPWAAIAQQPMPDREHSVPFWSSVASVFREQPGVMFDLFNEPFIYTSYLAEPSTDPWACWRDGCELTQFISGGQIGPDGEKTGYAQAYRWSTAGMQELIDVIRAAGAVQPVIANGLDWSNDVSGWLSHAPRDPRMQLVAGWHSYHGERCADASCWDAWVAPLARQVPVVVGETGDAVCTPVDYLGTFLPWADAQGISYLGWGWDTWKDCRDVLITSWSGEPTANYGSVFLRHLKQVG